jgi:hypothetical protein
MTPIEEKTREYLKHLSSREYLEAEGERHPAVLRALTLKQELDKLRFEALSPKNQMRELVERDVAEERAAKEAETRAAEDRALGAKEAKP